MVGILRQSASQVTHCMLSLRPLPALVDNYIWAVADSAGTAVVVDPGEAGPVLEAAEHGLKPVAILLTHHHPDHAGGVARLLEQFPIPVYGPRDARLSVLTFGVATWCGFRNWNWNSRSSTFRATR